MAFSNRVYSILSELNKNRDKYMNSNELGNIVHVSSRTIKRDIKEICDILKRNGAELDSTNQGYKIIVNDDDVFTKFIDGNIEDSKDSTANKSDKVKSILELLLANMYITQDTIADELYISRSSISKAITDVKEILGEYNITIQNKPHYGYILDGEEINIRKCMIRFLTERKEDNSIEISNRLTNLQVDFKYDLLKEIKDIFTNLKIVKNDIEISYITRYILITLLRIKNNCEIIIDNSMNISLDNNIIIVSKEITKIVKDKFNIELIFEEQLYISYIIGNDNITLKEIDGSKNEVEKMVVSTINVIKQEYDIDFFRDSTLIKGLINHLHTSYSRYCLNVTLDNPLINLIKSKYIEAYNYSILFSNIFKESYKINMNEEDIGYIALHFAASLERASMSNNLKAIIVCSSGVGTAELLKTRILKKFPNIYINGVYPVYILDSLEMSDIDLVISTVKLDKKSINKDVINVSPLLTHEDQEKINEYLEKRRDYEYVQSLMTKDMFFTNIEATTKEEVLEKMTEKLLAKDLINEKTKKQIINREQVSATEINKLVAIPHCITKENNISTLAVGILNRPIKWDKEQVQLVFLGVLDTKIKENRKVFTMLYKMTKNIDKVKRLADIKEFEYFKNRLFK